MLFNCFFPPFPQVSREWMVAIIDLSWYISLIVDSLGDRATFQRDIYLRFFSIVFVSKEIL